jgi:hypothetical protein
MGHQSSDIDLVDLARVLFESATAIFESISILQDQCSVFQDLGVPELLELLEAAKRKLFEAKKLFFVIVQIFKIFIDYIRRTQGHPQHVSGNLHLVMLSIDLIDDSRKLRDQAQQLLHFVSEIILTIRHI